MKRTLFLLLVGVTTMLLGAALGSGCSSVDSACFGSDSTLTPGKYALTQSDFRPDGYQLTLSTDRQSVDEEFDLGGKHYHFAYTISSLQHY